MLTSPSLFVDVLALSVDGLVLVKADLKHVIPVLLQLLNFLHKFQTSHLPWVQLLILLLKLRFIDEWVVSVKESDDVNLIALNWLSFARAQRR